MIGYICKYTPTIILESFGEKLEKIEPEGGRIQKADELFHVNMCSYVRGTLEYLLNSNIKQVVLVNCCDSVRRLYDVLKQRKEFEFVYMLDLPHKINDFSKKLYLNEIKKLILAYEEYSGKTFDVNKAYEILLSKQKKCCREEITEKSVALLGAKVNSDIIKIIEASRIKVHNYSCSGDTLDLSNINCERNFLESYVDSLLDNIPCMRMAEGNKRIETLKGELCNVDGVIYHGVKFCDYYSHEYMMLNKVLKKPMLKVESDYSKQGEGQMKTRIGAFLENVLGGNKNENTINYDGKYYMGIDSGSTSTNVVILNHKKEIISYSVVRTSSKSIDGANKAFHEAISSAGITKEELRCIIATGYGRVSIPFAHSNITEITCHAKGAQFLNPNIRTIIDIGGQDSKAIKLDDKGKIIDFAMNDKCAAGTGRFLEMMASALEIDIDNMGELALQYKEDIVISSMCSVFAESEVISLIAQNKEKSDIIHGLCESVAARTVSLKNRVKGEGLYMMTGGVAKNKGVVKSLENRLGEKIFIPEEPEIVGALGAALFAMEEK